jgi:hypothetical protein
MRSFQIKEEQVIKAMRFLFIFMLIGLHVDWPSYGLTRKSMFPDFCSLTAFVWIFEHFKD